MKRRRIKQPIQDLPCPERRVVRAFAALLALVLVPACGAKEPDRSGAAVGASCPDSSKQELECPTPNEQPDPSAFIDDLEDADSLIPTVNGRSGGWWAAGDETPGATLVPPPFDLAPPEAIEGGRCDSKVAMRVTGQGFVDWGSLLGVTLVHGERTDGEEGNLPYDASAYSGLEFWARIGDTSTDRVRFAVSDVNSEPYGGICTEEPGSADQCYDTFGAYLNGLTPGWRHYRIPFTSLIQRQFGLPAAAAATNALFSVQFNFEPGAVFDFWVDDLAFY
jgi:hypothetical protein